MNTGYTAVVKKEDDWGVGWIAKIAGVNCQETTREQLSDSVRITLHDALEFNRTGALDAACDGFEALELKGQFT